MQWRGGRKSNNVEDQTNGRITQTGGGGLVKGGGILSIIMLGIALLFGGGNLGDILNVVEQPSQQVSKVDSAQDTERKEFISVVFGHLEDFWAEEFKTQGFSYRQPTMVLYSGRVSTACGAADSSVGPFYCPGDEKVYLDLSFMDELANKYNAKGDFAMAYVVAHEVGPHVQQQLGISDQINSLRTKLSTKEFNKYQVRMELQADYYAGMWTKYIAGKTYNGSPILEIGDVESALTAANSIGDDTLQRKFQGYVVPDSFTHGSSKQRINWFNRGYEYGDFQHGNTFASTNLDLD